MTEIINLRRARKDKARADRATQASENRAKFGQSKPQKQVSKAGQRMAERRLDGHRIGSDAEE